MEFGREREGEGLGMRMGDLGEWETWKALKNDLGDAFMKVTRGNVLN